MILRPRQQVFKERSLEALKTHGACLGVAPTGAGKTVILSSVAGDYRRPLVLQHRDELVSQNRATFQKVNPKFSTDVFIADRKVFSRGATFAMVQTLCRPSNLASMPDDLDILVIDEAHHAAAESYQKILNRFRELNPNGHIFGLTATPNRTDKKALVGTFSTVSDIITLTELISGGFLVKPRCFVLDIGIRDALEGVPKTASDFDMGEVEAIMDHRPLNEKIIEEWKKVAGNRQTVAFCSTVAHAQHLCDAFTAAGISAVTVHGEMSEIDRRQTLKEFDAGDWQVVCNVAVLTEGWDCQPVSCVILARPCSAKSTMIQMVGRGLRKLDARRYPGQVKSDCIVLDFGFSLVTHGDFLVEPNLAPRVSEEASEGSAPEKTCPDCGMKVPAAVRVCPVCLHEWKVEAVTLDSSSFTMTEVDLIGASPFRWEPLFDNIVLIANGMSAWASVIELGGMFHALGCVVGKPIEVLDVSESRSMGIASADDFLRSNGDVSACRKTKSWLTLPPTEKQMEYLKGKVTPFSCSRYRASCIMTWMFNESKIKARLTA